MSRDNLSRARVLNTDTATLQLSTVQRMVAKILDKRDSLLHKSLNAVTEAARGRGQPCCNFGSRDAQRESPSFCFLFFTFPPASLRALFLVDAVVCLENHANRSPRPRSRSSGIRGLVLSRESAARTPCRSDQIRTERGGRESREYPSRFSRFKELFSMKFGEY